MYRKRLNIRYGKPEVGKKYFCKLRDLINLDETEYVVLEYVGDLNCPWAFNGRKVSDRLEHEYWIDLDTITEATEHYNEMKDYIEKQRATRR